MKRFKLAAFIVLSIVSVAAFSETVQETELKKLVGTRLGDASKIESVSQTPYLGLFEVRINTGEIMYTDSEAKYIIVGHVINTITHEDYTKARVDAANTIRFSDLPLASAVKMVKGDGSRVIATFEDPNCGYCKKFRKALQGVDNITVYTFMYNILADDSVTKSKSVWCSADPSKAWDDWMLRGVAPEAVLQSCLNDPNDQILALGKKLHIEGTPTIFFSDGTRAPGAMNITELEAKLVLRTSLPSYPQPK